LVEFAGLGSTEIRPTISEVVVDGALACEMLAGHNGWSDGGFGVGERMEVRHSRAMVRAALDGTMAATRGSPSASRPTSSSRREDQAGGDPRHCLVFFIDRNTV
jgi:hypothetical protein